MPLKRSKSLATNKGKHKTSPNGNLYIAEPLPSPAIDAMGIQLPRAQYSRRRHSHQNLLLQRSSKSMKSSSREVHLKALSDLQTAASRLPHPEVVYGAMIPEPDYSDDESEIKSTNMVSRNNKVNSTNSDNKEQQKPPPQPNGTGRLDDKGLVMPKKLSNPCLDSSEKKNLHKELMFNQKMGVSVLNQKTELQKAMEKHNDKKVLKEQEKEKKSQLTPFQKLLDERAQKIEQMEKTEKTEESKETEKGPSSEFEKIHAKVRAKMEVQ